MYLDCGAADIYAETVEAALKTALERQWANMVERRIYVTGSVEARGDGESVGKDYQFRAQPPTQRPVPLRDGNLTSTGPLDPGPHPQLYA